jgi:hypothetical protein
LQRIHRLRVRVQVPFPCRFRLKPRIDREIASISVSEPAVILGLQQQHPFLKSLQGTSFVVL